MKYRNTSLRARRKAVTLIELLVAIAATLVLMTAVTTAISMLGGRMGNNRATIEMIDQLRSVRQKLQSDLAGHTAQALPWQDAETGGGYIEIIEGPLKDHPSSWPNNDNRFGDTDDVIALTVRSQGPPFVSTAENSAGRNDDESYVAEVIWFLYRNQRPPVPQTPLYVLARYVQPFVSGNVGTEQEEKSLGELTKRENRLAHFDDQRPEIKPPFPYVLDFGILEKKTTEEKQDAEGRRYRVVRPEYVVLTNVLSFDVKVWDPQAPIYADSADEKRVMAPGDPGFTARGTVIGRGAYVDLGYQPALSPPSHFSSLPNPPMRTSSWPDGWAIWDTWPRFYERDGKDQDGSGKADQGHDGIDNDGINGVDDPGELETRPPYSHPLRGIRITIRIYEPASQQVRQISVVQHFMPE